MNNLRQHRSGLLWMFLWVHLISQFFMWMDEGYYDFRWMSDGWNWVVYAIYTSVVYILCFGIYLSLFRKRDRLNRWGILASTIAGFGIFTFVLLGVYMTMH